jgi:porphobilinogen deaminase
LEIADPKYSARISKELIRLATRESGLAEALIETVREGLRAFVERLKEVHEVLFNL